MGILAVFGDDHFWETNGESAIFQVYTDAGGYGGGAISQRFFNVRFDPESLRGKPVAQPPHQAVEPIKPNASAVEPAIARKRVGAPRKGWWDDLWIEILSRVQRGELHGQTAKSAARLEDHLLDIAEGMGFSPGDSSLKPMSLKLFKYLKESGGK